MDTENSGPSPENMGLKADDMKVSGLERTDKPQELNSSTNKEKEKFSPTKVAKEFMKTWKNTILPPMLTAQQLAMAGYFAANGNTEMAIANGVLAGTIIGATGVSAVIKARRNG